MCCFVFFKGKQSHNQPSHTNLCIPARAHAFLYLCRASSSPENSKTLQSFTHSRASAPPGALTATGQAKRFGQEHDDRERRSEDSNRQLSLPYVTVHMASLLQQVIHVKLPDSAFTFTLKYKMLTFAKTVWQIILQEMLKKTKKQPNKGCKDAGKTGRR